MNAVVGIQLSVYFPVDGGVYLREEFDCALAYCCGTLVGSQVTVPTAEVNDDKLHRYGVRLDDGKGGGAGMVRFLLFKKPNGVIVAWRMPARYAGR